MEMQWANLIVLIVNTLLTGVLGYAALRVSRELEEMNEDDDES